MKRILSILLASTVLMFACQSETGTSTNIEGHEDCIIHFLSEFDMIAYNGGDIPCRDSYLIMYANDDTKFAILHNDCVDLQPQLIKDCEGNELCTYVTEDGCFEMVQNSDRIGIIGVAD